MAENKNLAPQIIGRIGELATEIEMLKKGWLVGNFNSSVGNCAAYDLFATKNGKETTIRVKSFRSSSNGVQYNAKENGSPFLNLDENNKKDFVVIVRVSEENGAEEFFIIPTQVIDKLIQDDHSNWIKGTKKDGSARKNTSHRAIKLKGTSSYADFFKSYLNNWDILENI